MSRLSRGLSAFAVIAVAVHVPAAGAAGLSESFDGSTPPTLPAGWSGVSAGTNATLWGTNATIPFSPPNSAFASDPAGTGCNQPIPPQAVADEYLFGPTVTLGAPATLTFRNNFNTEAGATEAYDGGVLEVIVNGGAPQDIIAAGGVFRAGGYNRTIKTGFGNPISGRQAWSGNSGGYIVTTVDFPASLDGSTVRFVWRLGADCSVAGVGWRIDDVRFGRGPVATTAPATAISTGGGVLNGSVIPGDFSASYHFEYGPTAAYGTSTPEAALAPGTTPRAVEAAVSGLDPNLTHHFRLVTTNALRSTAGADETFVTSSTPPDQSPPTNDPPATDSTAPETTIDALVRNKRRTKATATFSANEPASTFHCRVDAADFLPCVSPLKLTRKGKHTLEVRGVDAAGNVDQTPAAKPFKLKPRRR